MTPALGEAFLISAIRFSGLAPLIEFLRGTAWKKLRGRPRAAISSSSCAMGRCCLRWVISWRLVAMILSRMVLMTMGASRAHARVTWQKRRVGLECGAHCGLYHKRGARQR